MALLCMTRATSDMTIETQCDWGYSLGEKECCVALAHQAGQGVCSAAGATHFVRSWWCSCGLAEAKQGLGCVS